MRRWELEHVLRAASAITRQDEFIVIGSQALLGEHPDAPEELLVSREVDLYPRNKPEDSTLIDGVIGEGSIFHDTFGYYAHGIGPETACLPVGWETRLIPVSNENTRGAIGFCLETHDLAVSKLVAGRPRDMDFLRGLFLHGLATPSAIHARLSMTRMDAAVLEECRIRLERLEKEKG